jgi:hypothetical protein
VQQANTYQPLAMPLDTVAAKALDGEDAPGRRRRRGGYRQGAAGASWRGDVDETLVHGSGRRGDVEAA